MKKGSTKFLKAVIVLMGIVVLGIMLWFPHIEGRNANAPDFFSVYLHDPFLIYVYVGTIPFFIALYQAYTLLTYIEQDKTFSSASAKILKNIKYCAIVIVIFVAGAMGQIISFSDRDDAPGVVVVGFIIMFASAVIATFAGVLQKLLQNAIDIKSENDLTV